jgi:hypothetical protein
MFDVTDSMSQSQLSQTVPSNSQFDIYHEKQFLIN